MSALDALATALHNTPWQPMSVSIADVSKLEFGRRRARTVARGLGHTLGEWEIDTPTSAVAECIVCEQLAAVDVAYEGYPVEYVGRALSRPCAGPYSVLR